MFVYKLMMFGFSDLCESYEEVLIKLKNIPSGRINCETLEQCYLIDLKTGEKYNIECKNNGTFFVKDFNDE